MTIYLNRKSNNKIDVALQFFIQHLFPLYDFFFFDDFRIACPVRGLL